MSKESRVIQTKREAFLESKFQSPEQREELEKKHWASFERYAGYKGNGCYEWRGIFATNTRELFLLGILERERIYIEQVK